MLLVALTAIALLWPALLNGGPFWFPDTSTYIRSADAAVVTITDSPSEWSNELVRVAPAQGGPAGDGAELPVGENAESRAVGAWAPTRSVLTGRSIYYGFLLYLPMRFFGPWGGIVLQALIVAGLIVSSLLVAARATRADPRIVVGGATAVLALLTPLPFYASMLMPDVYSGVLILVLATTIAFWGALSPMARVLFIGASAAMATFHTTHTLITAAVAGAAFLVASGTWARLRPVIVALPVIAVALIGQAAFSYAVKSRLGQEPLSPPFLSARITASGPGTAYLQRNCTGSPDDFALCAHRERLPLFSDDFLWQKDPARGLFQLVDDREQRRIASEDKAFFLAVFADDPVAALSASAAAFVLQLGAFDLDNFNYSGPLKSAAPDKLPARAEAQFAASRAYDGRMPVAFTIGATIAATLVSLLMLGVLWARFLRSRERPLPSTMRWTLLLVLGVLANALICGTLSKPGARYQMRLIWLIPAAAIVTVPISRRPLRRHGEGDAERATG